MEAESLAAPLIPVIPLSPVEPSSAPAVRKPATVRALLRKNRLLKQREWGSLSCGFCGCVSFSNHRPICDLIPGRCRYTHHAILPFGRAL
jgi:hypothetical protein